MKRLICIFLLFALMLSAAACGGKSQQSSNENPADSQPKETTGVNEYGWEVPKDTLTINVYGGYGDQAEDIDKNKSIIDKFLKDKFNVAINWSVYNVDMDEKLNLMLAAGDYPEVITGMSDAMAEKFIAQGKAIDLTSLVEKYGPNIQKGLGKYINLLKDDSGKLYKLSSYWGENPNVAGWDFAVRYDWWKETGMPIYKTPEEYYQTMKAILAKHPVNANGEKVYAIGDGFEGNSKGLYGALLAAYGFKNGYKVDDNTGDFTHWINTNEGLEIAKYINRFYREGMIDPDFLSTKYDDWIAKCTNERYAGNIGTWWYTWVGGQEAWAEKEGSAYNNEKRYINVTVKAPGVENSTAISSDYISDYRIIITDKCKDPVSVMKWLNWECSGIGTMIIGYGPPDPENVWDIKDDKWIIKDSAKVYNNKNVAFHDVRTKYGANLYRMIAPGGWFKDEHLDPTVTRVSVYDMWPIDSNGKFLDPGVNLSWQYCDGKSWDSTLFKVTFKDDDPVTNINQTIKDELTSEWAKVITSKTEAECEAKFNATREKLNKLGLHDLEKFYKDSYKANKDKVEK